MQTARFQDKKPSTRSFSSNVLLKVVELGIDKSSSSSSSSSSVNRPSSSGNFHNFILLYSVTFAVAKFQSKERNSNALIVNLFEDESLLY